MARIIRLRWNPNNIAHIWRHQVRTNEVQEVVDGDSIVEAGHSERRVFIGPTVVNRMLAVVLEAEGGDVYFPVTARPASREERRRYEEQRGGAEQ